MADRFSSAIRGFGCLYEDFDEEFFSHIVREYAVSLLSMIIERHHRRLMNEGDSILAMLEYPLTSDHSPFLSPHLAHCLNALKSGNTAEAAGGLIQILLNLSCSGVPGNWKIELDEPRRFHWDYYLLPKARSIAVRSDGREALVTLSHPDGEKTFTFTASDEIRGWRNSESETIPYIVTRRASVLLLTGAHLEQFDLLRPKFPALDEITPSHKENVVSCLTFLWERLPACSSWIERVLRYLCLVQESPGTMHSGSFEGYFGFLFMSDLPDPIKMAEMLIHECSHQYFAILLRFTELTDEDGRLYYSPFVKKDRPADRILLAYHAFTNVELFYKECIRLGISVPHCEKAIAQLRPDLDYVERALVSDIRFTPAGRCVIDSLLSRRTQYEFAD